MRKIIELDEHFPQTGEMTVQPILLWGSGRRIDTSRITKYASVALDYIKSVTPEPNKTILLLNALGAEETYGPNRNGDGFPERPVPARGKFASMGRRWFIEPGQELTEHYASFETNPAHTFQHHANRDPAKASGSVKKAFWNPRMHRVELLVGVDNDKDPEWVKRANDGEFVPVSMGCRIKYDVCARCGNQAPTRADYCDHVKYAMNQVDENGFKDYVHNPSPDFFDISRVFRPADRTGYTLKKVADHGAYEVRLSAALGEDADRLATKSSAALKLSEIDKVIRAEPVASSTLSPDEKSFIVKFRDHATPALRKQAMIDVRPFYAWPLGEVLSAAASRGVVFKDAEFIQLAVMKLAGVSPSAVLVEKVAAASRYSLALFADRPDLLEEVIDSGTLESSKIAHELTAIFDGLRVKHAYMGEMLYRRLVPEGIGMRDDAAPTTDVMHVGPYETTRGAAIDAQDATTRAHMGKVLGGSAMLLGGYKALTAFPALRKFKMPLAIGAGALGAATLGKRPGHTMRTDEGYDIPNITELSSKTAASTASIVHLIECAATSRAQLDFSRVKLSSTTSMDVVADTLGAIILA